MQPNTQLLYSVWDSVREFRTLHSTSLEENRLDELLASFFCAGPFYYFIIDSYDMQVSHASSGLQEMHGLEPKTVNFDDILAFIHPDDMEYVSQSEAQLFDLLFHSIGKQKLTRYKMSYCFRMKTIDGRYRLFHHQSVTLTTDENGGLGKSLNVHVDISHLTTTNNYKPSLIGLFGQPSYLDLDLVNQIPITETKSLFTQREKQIIQLLSQGLTNPKIADKLVISLHTAKNHRKNILHKAECKNVGQLVAKCVAEGWI